MGKSKKENASFKKKTNLFNPIQIKEGELLTDKSGKKWKTGKAIGAGGFGEIYIVFDDVLKSGSHDALYIAKIEPHKSGPLFVEMNFYIRVAKQEMIDKWKKDKKLKHLGMPNYIAFGSHQYRNEKYRFLILKKFGQDLSKLFQKCKKKFHIKTVFTLGLQILDILEYIHSHGYIHADIKDSNLLLGNDKNDENVYLLDYGLACKYVDSLGVHKEYNPDQRKAHDGTLQYTSRDAHVGAHSRRSDLEGLAYNMIHWLCGFLPWESELSDPEKVAQEKESYMNNIPLFLKKCFGDDPPVALSHFLKYVVSLSFKSKPDYEYCKALLRQGIRQYGYADDGKLNFDSPPVKLKNRKRMRQADTENWVELKPIKIPRAMSRQPCVPVQAEFNRITRQQTAANFPALRSRETFDWVKVLQSDPEKILKAHITSNNQLKKNKMGKQQKDKPKHEVKEIDLKKEKTNPLENPTPAILAVLKLRNVISPLNAGKRIRNESNSYNSTLYHKNFLTPAMEEVIMKKEFNLHKTKTENKQFTSTVAKSTRSNRLESKNECSIQNSKIVEMKIITRKSLIRNVKSLCYEESRKKFQKYFLRKNKYLTDISLNLSQSKKNKKSNKKTLNNVKNCRKVPSTFRKTSNKKSLSFTKKKKNWRREVSPSIINMVSRLRSGNNYSNDLDISKIVNYAANSPLTKRKRKGRKNNYNNLSSAGNSTIIL